MDAPDAARPRKSNIDLLWSGESVEDSILIVDDNLDFAENLQEIIQREGLRCRIATSLREASALVSEHEFSIAFLDINLPDGSGLALLRELRSRRPGLLAIMVTGY